MEDWIDITTASWEGILRPEELAQIEEATLERELTKMASEIQTMIASHSPNTVSANPLKIPAGFLGRAMLVARNRVLSGIPDFQIDDDRRKEAEQAEKWFLEVARGNIRPQPATDAIPNAAAPDKPASVEIVSAPGSRTGRNRMNGL